MQQMNPYIFCNDNAEEMALFYRDALSARIGMMLTFGDMQEKPSWYTDDIKDKFAHIVLKTGDFYLTLCDYAGFPEPFNGYHGFSINIAANSEKEGKEYFNALSNGGTMTVPYEPCS
jgi:PhnB protein